MKERGAPEPAKPTTRVLSVLSGIRARRRVRRRAGGAPDRVGRSGSRRCPARPRCSRRLEPTRRRVSSSPVEGGSGVFCSRRGVRGRPVSRPPRDRQPRLRLETTRHQKQTAKTGKYRKNLDQKFPKIRHGLQKFL